MAAIQPIVTPAWVVGLFMTFGVLFVPLGAWLRLKNGKVVELEQRYEGAGKTVDCSISASNEGRKVIFFNRRVSVDTPGFSWAHTHFGARWTCAQSRIHSFINADARAMAMPFRYVLRRYCPTVELTTGFQLGLCNFEMRRPCAQSRMHSFLNADISISVTATQSDAYCRTLEVTGLSVLFFDTLNNSGFSLPHRESLYLVPGDLHC